MDLLSTATPLKPGMGLDHTGTAWKDVSSSPFLNSTDQENLPPSAKTPDYPRCVLSPKGGSGLRTLKSSSRSARSAETVRIFTDGPGREELQSSNDQPPSPSRSSRACGSPLKSPCLEMQDTTMEDNDVEASAIGTQLFENPTHDPARISAEVDENSSLSVGEQSNIDDTCFTAFSEVPTMDMTMFAKLGERSPTKHKAPALVGPHPDVK